jgi:hypothetical protein
LTALTADFDAVAETGQAQADAAYRVSTESIKIKLGSPLDGQVYGFAADLRRNFPGAVVLTSLKLARPPKLDPDMLAQLNKGGGLVSGEMELLWRTALANAPGEKKP